MLLLCVTETLNYQMNFKIKLIALFFITGISYSQGIVTQNGRLQVDGNQITNNRNVAFSVAGNSMFWSGFQTVGGKFYQSEVVDHLAQDWGSGVIRAAMAVEEADGDGGVPPTSPRFPGARVKNPSGLGYFNNPAVEIAKVKTIIDAAIANDIYVIVDFHSHFAHFYKDEAIEFFTQIAKEYKNDNHIIYEIFNEPIGLADNRANGSDNASFGQFTQTWSQIIKPYAIDVIKAIRAEDPDNLIIVGTPGFSQGVEAAANNPITTGDLGFANGTNLNIAYTLHFYAGQVEHRALRASATRAMDRGIALFVTEWGTVSASGDGAVDESETLEWMKFMKQNNISHANWSISDKFEGASVIQGNRGIQGLLNNELTESGNFVRCIIQNWDNDNFENCNVEPSTEEETSDSNLVPNGVGFKVEVEAPTQLNPTTKSRIDFVSPGLSVGRFDTEAILTGFKQGESVVVHTNGFTRQGSYTVQVVLATSSAGHQIILQRNAGTTTLATAAVPNTGGLDKYQIVQIPGVPFDASLQDVAIAVGSGGTGTFNIESIYLIEDGSPSLSVSEFDADLAKKINMYPNPVVDLITIDSSEDIDYKVFGLDGGELISRTSYTKPVDVASFNSGIYFIQLYVKGQTQVFKFVKQ